MGFFSWLTADDNQSIANVHSNKAVRTVYLLQPEINGKREPAIVETRYEGFGVFGGVNAYAWLAARNFGDASLINTAIFAECGEYHTHGDSIFICSMHMREAEFRKIIATDRRVVEFQNFEQVLPCGNTPNQLIARGVWFANKIELQYPLKFSFNPNAVYENLPPSENCPDQGYFYQD